MFGGVQVATSWICLYSEAALSGAFPVFAVTIDFVKMYNCICPRMAGKIASYMGLDNHSVEQLLLPIARSVGYWRLTGHACSPTIHTQRGLPQGLSTSVCLADLIVATLLWHTSHIPNTKPIAYVDDLSFCSGDLGSFRTVVRKIRRFSDTFALGISDEKTVLWGTEEATLRDCAQEWGYSYTNAPSLLGADWPTSSKARAPHVKELKRLDKAKERLIRLRHLPSHVSIKASALVCGILSLLSYVNVPSVLPFFALRSYVRAALGISGGSPEVVFRILTSTPLDPVEAWTLANLRLWHAVSRLPRGKLVLERVLVKKTKGRLGSLVKALAKRGVNLTAEALEWGEDTLHLSRPWCVFKQKWRELCNQHALTSLAVRRPKYAGLENLNWKLHRSYLKACSPYNAMTLLRIWSGCPMTRVLRHKWNSTNSPTCPCGADWQSLTHLMWDCGLVRGRPRLSEDPSLPMYRRASLLCEWGADSFALIEWKVSCKWAICVLNQAFSWEDSRPRVAPNLSIGRGHLLERSLDSKIVFCVKCHVSRVPDQYRHIASKPCKNPDASTYREGDEKEEGAHKLSLVIKAWKVASARPAWVCVRCEKFRWANSCRSLGERCVPSHS